MNSRLFAAALAGLVLLTTARAAEDGFAPIFDGQSLTGWEGNTAIWSVREGAITGVTKKDTNLKHNTFLVWKAGTVDNFELRFRYRMTGGNSGVQYRSKVVEQGAQGPIVAGYQADMEAGKNYTGILYEERGRGILATRGQCVRIVADGDKHKVEVTGSVGKSDDIQASIKQEDWNDYVITAQGNHLVHAINGHTTVDVTDEDAAHAAKSGVLALQVHVGDPMIVQFKDLRLKKLAAGVAAGNDLDALQGEWVAASARREGEAVPEEWVKSLRLKFKGEKYDIAWTDGGDSGSVKLKSDGSPKQMDIASDGAGALAGIYEFKDGQLRVAYGVDGGGRPKDFEAKPGSASMVVTYKKK